MGCCGWLDLLFSQSTTKDGKSANPSSSQEHLLSLPAEEAENLSRTGEESSALTSADVAPASTHGNGCLRTEVQDRQWSETALEDHIHGSQPRVKQTLRAVRGEDSSGKKMINEYVRESSLGTGSYSKVVLYRSKLDGQLYAIKSFHKSRLRKIKVAPSETAWTDVLREVSILRELDHPNIVKLIEVIDDPESDRLYLVLEYVEGGWMFEGAGPAGGIGEVTARRYIKDIVVGLMYLHSHRIVHGDIKPENLLINGTGQVKICDFSVSQKFEDNNDELRRSPGTSVFTAPECITGSTYHGKAADVWALGVTLYCMVSGCYPFIGDTLQSIYDEIVQSPLRIPEGMNPDLVDLLKGLLCKDPKRRLTLDAVAKHKWMVEDLRGY